MPLIHISDDNPTGTAETHFRKVNLVDWNGSKKRAVVNLGGGPRPTPTTEKGVPIYVHDWFGAGKHAHVVSTRSGDFRKADVKYVDVPLLTGDESKAAQVENVDFPKLVENDRFPIKYQSVLPTYLVHVDNGYTSFGMFFE